MINLKITKKRTIAFLLTIVLILTNLLTCSSVFAEEQVNTDEISTHTTYQNLVDNSIVLKLGKSFYFNRGEKIYFSNDNKTYFPKYSETEIFVKPDNIVSMFDVKLSYSKKTDTFEIKNSSHTVTIRVGEDAVYVNGVGKYIQNIAQYNGKGMFLPVTVIAEALDYDVELYRDVIILNNTGIIHKNVDDINIDNLARSTELENGFTNLKLNPKNNKNYIDGWSFYDWGPADGSVMDAGFEMDDSINSYAAYLGAVKRSFIGLHQGNTARIGLDKEKYAYKIDFKARCSEDYVGNNPVIVALYYFDNTYIGSDFLTFEQEVTNEWKNFSVTLSNSLYKEREATSISIVMATQFDEDCETEPAGYLYYSGLNVSAYSEKSQNLINAIRMLDEKFDEYIYTYGFEKNENSMGFYDWGYGRGYSIKPNTNDDSSNAFEGIRFGEIQAFPTSYGGFVSASIPVLDSKRALEVSFYARVSDDYNANIPMARVNYTKDGKFVKQRTLLPLRTNIVGREWTKLTFVLPYRDWDNTKWDFNGIELIVGTSANGVSETNQNSGKIFIDNITMKYAESSTGYAEIDFSYDDMYSIYELGRTVTYSPDDVSQLAPYTEFEATVYDIDGNIINKETKSKADVIKSGFTINPEQPGYYEYEVLASTIDGYKYIIAPSYSAKYDNYTYVDVVSPRRAFVVTKGSAKPMDERNDYLMISNDSHNIDILTVADKLGFSGVRIHTVKWGDNGGDKSARFGFQTDRGKYNWTNADIQINNCNQVGFKNIIANIFGTPRFAVPTEYFNSTQTSLVGAYHYNLYAPANMDVVTEAMTAFMDRYKDKITAIEFYNEPYYGNAKTAFWYDTADNFIEMSTVAAKAIKSADSDIKFISAGHLATAAGAQFCDDTLKNEEFKNLIDGISHHGHYDTTDMFKQVMQKHGIEDKLVINSESYAYSPEGDVGNSKDYRTANMKYLMHQLYQLKQGVDADCFFTMDEGDANLLNAGIKTTTWGVLRTYPYIEPRQGVSTLFMFNKLMGKEFNYEGEYDFGDVKGVRFNSDGKPLVIFWNSKNESFELPESLKTLLDKGATLIDFEGKDKLDINNLHMKKMYYMYDIDENLLSSIEYTEDAALSADFAYPFYTAKSDAIVVPKLEELDSSLPIIDNSAKKPFNEKTFELADDIEWHEDNWNFVSRNGSDTPGFGVRHAVHINDEGLYILIDVDDAKFYQKAKTDTVNNMWKGDSVQIAFNTTLATTGSDRLECQLAMTDDGVIFYKQVSQNIGAMLPDNFTKVNEIMPKEYTSVVKTEDGMMYKIFIPMGELFTYVYPGPENYIRLSLLVNNTDDDSGSKGYYEWGSGIGGTKSVEPYAIVKLTEINK